MREEGSLSLFIILMSTHNTHKVKPVGTDFLMHETHKELEWSGLTI